MNCVSPFTDLQQRCLRIDSFNRNFPSRYSGVMSIRDFICIQAEAVLQALATDEVKVGGQGQPGPPQRLQLPTQINNIQANFPSLCQRSETSQEFDILHRISNQN